jgi:type VI protein secretion system component VasF
MVKRKRKKGKAASSGPVNWEAALAELASCTTASTQTTQTSQPPTLRQRIEQARAGYQQTAKALGVAKAAVTSVTWRNRRALPPWYAAAAPACWPTTTSARRARRR